MKNNNKEIYEDMRSPTINGLKSDADLYGDFIKEQDSETLRSILKSNSFDRTTRKSLNRIWIPNKVLQEFVPVIATITVVNVVNTVIQETLNLSREQ